jgi:hypothetical protein
MRETWLRALLTGFLLYVALQFMPSSFEGQPRALAVAALAGLAAGASGKLVPRGQKRP